MQDVGVRRPGVTDVEKDISGNFGPASVDRNRVHWAIGEAGILARHIYIWFLSLKLGASKSTDYATLGLSMRRRSRTAVDPKDQPLHAIGAAYDGLKLDGPFAVLELLISLTRKAYFGVLDLESLQACIAKPGGLRPRG